MNAHVLLQGSVRPAPRNAKRLGNVEHNEHVEVTVTLRGPKLPDVSTVAKKALSRRQLATQYGAKAADADMVARVLKNYGLTVENISPAGRGMRVSGSVAQMEAAFKAKLGIYRSITQGDFRGREGDIRIPAELDGIVTGVFGLDERRVAQRKLPVAAARRALAKAPAKGKVPRRTSGPQPLGYASPNHAPRHSGRSAPWFLAPAWQYLIWKRSHERQFIATPNGFLLRFALSHRIDARIRRASAWSTLTSANVTSGYCPKVIFFSCPSKRYFPRHSLPPAFVTNRNRPLASAIL
jgi:hypothetical protein